MPYNHFHESMLWYRDSRSAREVAATVQLHENGYWAIHIMKKSMISGERRSLFISASLCVGETSESVTGVCIR
ncbi:hypothetical protein GJ744_003603 [Endocarpon pusillum]|uniref:Uncharacterized protein n=1 Tax=Endocarpon pusillum TaxID=364733 RepID=A0A8H7DZQ6_9EURO|nr:hypothetical protein GJ744_003603 [Endocarpon pusillum]